MSIRQTNRRSSLPLLSGAVLLASALAEPNRNRDSDPATIMIANGFCVSGPIPVLQPRAL
jgi:hypothetical protein